MIKRIIGVIAVVVMVALLLTGCGTEVNNRLDGRQKELESSQNDWERPRKRFELKSRQMLFGETYVVIVDTETGIEYLRAGTSAPIPLGPAEEKE